MSGHTLNKNTEKVVDLMGKVIDVTWLLPLVAVLIVNRVQIQNLYQIGTLN